MCTTDDAGCQYHRMRGFDDSSRGGACVSCRSRIGTDASRSKSSTLLECQVRFGACGLALERRPLQFFKLMVEVAGVYQKKQLHSMNTDRL